MKGIVFSAFVDHVEDCFGLETSEAMISSCNLPSGAAYTSVGTYDHNELVQMLTSLSELTGQSIQHLLKTFGRHLFSYLTKSYPDAISHAKSAFALISSIDNHIHVEVRKLYPEADLPSFTHQVTGPDEMMLTYRSERGLADLAEGLLYGCFEYFGEMVEINREDLSDGSGKEVRFALKRGADTRG